MFSGITGNVLILGLVSFFTDVSSEMIYPLLPLFLTSVLGAGPAFLGVIEGVAESTAALLKLASGIWSDRVRRRKRLVLAGYGLSAVARPLVAIATGPLAVLGIRFSDRVGKGIRSSPRDALIADSVAPQLRGRAYGFHRAMDHAGALVGPLIATALLAGWTKDLRLIFALAAIPGLLAVLLIVLKVREAVTAETFLRAKGSFLGDLPRGPMRRYLLILFLFTLGNSTDAFLLLRAGSLGVAATRLPLLVGFLPRGQDVLGLPPGFPLRPGRPARHDPRRLGGLCPGLPRFRPGRQRVADLGALRRLRPLLRVYRGDGEGPLRRLRRAGAARCRFRLVQLRPRPRRACRPA